jgi:5-methylcytosine-specific restriction endonuclease McrA
LAKAAPPESAISGALYPESILAKKWHRLSSILQEAGYNFSAEQAADSLAVLLEISKRYKDPPICFIPGGRIKVAGIELNALKFSQSMMFSIESRGILTGLTYKSALEYGAIRLARRQGKREVKKHEKGGRNWTDSLVIGNSSPSVFYSSTEWLQLRYKVLKIRGNKCEACGRGPADGTCIHVDHIKPRSIHPELALNASNLQILCKDCNLGKSNIDSTDWRQGIDPFAPHGEVIGIPG